MATTTVGVNDPRAVKRWGTQLAVDTQNKQYFKRFTGKGDNNIIEQKVELEDVAGDTVSYDLNMRLRGSMTLGDKFVEGNAERLIFYTDQVTIDQARMGASGGSRMSRKRTIHDLRRIAKDRASDFMSKWCDEGMFTYLSGDAGFSAINQDNSFDTEFAGNPIQAPDSDHILYAGSATSKATLTTSDIMSHEFIERVAVKPKMMNAVNPDVVQMSPVRVEGEEHFILLMSPFQAHTLRTQISDLSWSKVAQAAATAEGRKSPIFRGGLGMINNTILHEHSAVRLYNDYGAGGNVSAGRALLLGAQAGVVAYGAGGNGTRMSWVEKLVDADDKVEIYCGFIGGWKKTRFGNNGGTDFGVCAVDTYAADPNPVVAA